MADYQAVPTGSSTDSSRQPPVTATLVVYALFALAAVAGIAGHGMLVAGAALLTTIGVVGVIIAYVSRSDARGTWTESHLSWLIRTFWWSLLWNCIGWVIAITVIGLPVALAIWVATTIWVIYRVVRGYLAFHKSEPITGM
jgi:uncharacterized membrane protein